MTTRRPIRVYDADGNECVAYRDETPVDQAVHFVNWAVKWAIRGLIAWALFWIVWTTLVLTDSPLLNWTY